MVCFSSALWRLLRPTCTTPPNPYQVITQPTVELVVEVSVKACQNPSHNFARISTDTRAESDFISVFHRLKSIPSAAPTTQFRITRLGNPSSYSEMSYLYDTVPSSSFSTFRERV